MGMIICKILSCLQDVCILLNMKYILVEKIKTKDI